MSGSVKILFFGLLKDIMGQKEFSLELSNEINFTEFLELLTINYENFSKVKYFIENKDAKQPVFIVLNGDPLKNPSENKIRVGDEVAFLPPVGGG